jgi:Tol biopolymer transport system component
LADDAWQLTTHPWPDYSPDWSPDGTQIAFSAWATTTFLSIWVIPATGGTAALITLGDLPAWSPDGTQIAYYFWHWSQFGIFIMSATGPHNTTQITEGGMAPCWSPDGSLIAFVGAGVFIAEGIWVVSATGGTATQVTTDPSDSYPAWSPDGSQIAFHSNRSGNSDIWVMPATGGPPFTRITDDLADDECPAWSPDGSQIAFHSNRSGNSDIWVMPATGGPPFTRVTDAGGWSPAWSPDGTKIAFRRGLNIWIIDVGAVAVEPTTWGAIKASFK